MNAARSELYAYDGLNQVTSFQRGTLNGTNDGLTGSASRSQSWDFDAVGNFDSQTTDGTTQTRTANKQNEVTSISGATTPTYDAAGNMTGDEAGRLDVYDGWGRLVVVKNSGGTTLATYRYDGLHRRVRDIEAATTDLYYSAQWQVLEEDVSGSVVNSYAWSPVYVDALIARDSGGTRLYAVQDANWNVVALVTTSGTVAERYAYDSYGTQTVMDGSWGSRSASSYNWAYGFQGRPYDAAAGGYNFRNREEDPVLGRWGRNDPLGLGAGDVDIYRSLRNSPAIVTDPLGLQGFGGNFGPRSQPPSPIAPPGPALPPGQVSPSGHVPGFGALWGPEYYPGRVPPQPSFPPVVDPKTLPPGGPVVRAPRPARAVDDFEDWGNRNLWEPLAGLFGPDNIAGPNNAGSRGGAVSGTVIGGGIGAVAGIPYGPWGMLVGAMAGGVVGGVEGSAQGSQKGDSFSGGLGAGVVPGLKSGGVVVVFSLGGWRRVLARVLSRAMRDRGDSETQLDFPDVGGGDTVVIPKP